MSARGLVLGLVLVSLTMTVVGCGSKVTKENADKIEEGMTMSEVEDILGKGEKMAGAEGSLPDIGIGGKVDMYKWEDDKGNVITVGFKDDKVVKGTVAFKAGGK